MKKIMIIFMCFLMIFVSCQPDANDESNSTENVNTNNNSSNNGSETPTSSNDEGNGNGSETPTSSNTTSCIIGQRNVLELNYIAHYEDSTYKFNSDTNDSSVVKSMPFTMRCNASSTSEVMRVIVITVTYNNGTLNFAINSQSPYYNITNVTYDGSSTVDIYIQHN